MKINFGFVVLAFLAMACGDAKPPANIESEQCADTWWYLEQDGEVVLDGNKAGFTNLPGELYGTPGVNYSQGYFADTDPTIGQGCTFLSKMQLIEGTHDNLTCSIATEQGPNPQWVGAESGSDGDHRPILTSINYEGDYIIGTFEGTMFRLDTISISPPNIQGKVVNYSFEFQALREESDGLCIVDKESPCKEACWKKYIGCRAKCKKKALPERPNCYSECSETHSRCRRSCDD